MARNQVVGSSRNKIEIVFKFTFKYFIFWTFGKKLLKIGKISVKLLIIGEIWPKNQYGTTYIYGINTKRYDLYIGSEMIMKNSGGEVCVMEFLGSREGFHRVCSFDDSSSEYAPLIG